jgi:predicted permease
MPDWAAAVRSRLAALGLPPVQEREIVDEWTEHLDDRYRSLEAEGMPEAEAIDLVLAELDGETLAGEMRALRDAAPRPVPPFGSDRPARVAGIRQDAHYAARMLRKAPGFSAAAILTLALGIGANTAIFSLVNATLLQRLPVPNRARLAYVFSGDQRNVLSYPAYRALRDGASRLDALAAWGGITASLNADGETDLVSGAIVTGELFEALGVSATRGRLLSRADDVTPMAHPVAVVSDRLWKSRFAGRDDIVGTEIRLNGGVFTIVGVTPPAFTGPQLGVVRDVYVPMMMQPLMRPPRAGYSGEMNPDLLNNPRNGWLFQIALLEPGVTRAQAEAEVSAAATRYARSMQPSAPEQHLALVPVDVGDPSQRSQMRSVAVLLAGAVGVVLLIACANVANLLMSRAAARRREVAIRLALGASRPRIVRQLLTESLLLALLGGAAGAGLAAGLVSIMRAAPPPAGALPVAVDFVIDLRVLLFSLTLSIVTGLLFGLAPALQASSPGLVPALKDEIPGTAHWPRGMGVKNILVVSEVALTLLLLIVAGLFIRSLQVARTVDPGYAVDELISAPLNINLLRYTKAQGREFYRRVVDRVQEIPGVTSASLARVAVLGGGGRVTAVTVEGRPDTGDRSQSEGGGFRPTAGRTAMANVVGPAFFRTLGIPLIRGRVFGTKDDDRHPLVVVLSQTMASGFFPGEDAIGKRISIGGSGQLQWMEIVGIVRDSKYASLTEPSTPVLYVPLAQQHETGVTLYARATGNPAALATQLRSTIQSIEPNLPVPDIQTMTETVGASLYASRMGALLLTVFGGLALLLACVGVYAVLAYSIARRTREIGIRMALGAEPLRVLGLVFREGMGLVAVGLACGLLAGFFATMWLRQFLYGVSPHDIVTFVFVPAALSGASMIACWLPARRATRVDPLVALRDT